MTICIFPKCTRDPVAQGLCGGHYKQKSKGAELTPLRAYGGDWRKRFWLKVRKTQDCWLWVGSKTPRGYGKFGLDSRTKSAHRLAYELTQGRIPEGLEIDHMCLNRACVNPDHLRLATRSQNTQNKMGARRDSKTGIRGVSKSGGRRAYIAQAHLDGNRNYLGSFPTAHDASQAVSAWRREYMPYSVIDSTTRNTPSDPATAHERADQK